MDARRSPPKSVRALHGACKRRRCGRMQQHPGPLLAVLNERVARRGWQHPIAVEL